VDFVNDVDFELAVRGRVTASLAEFADLFDAVVGGAVNFQHVQRPALSDLATGIALVARRRRRSLGTVQRLGEDAGDGGLTDAARPDEQIGVGEAVLSNGVLERGGYVLLTHHLLELLRAPFARQDLILICHLILAAKTKVVVHPELTSHVGLRAAVEAPVRLPDGTWNIKRTVAVFRPWRG